MQPPCMVRSCHPIILRCIPMMSRNLGKSRSLQDTAFAFISHTWISNHRRTANMTLWRYCCHPQERKRQESRLEHRTAKLRAGRGDRCIPPILNSKTPKWLSVSALAVAKLIWVFLITTWALSATWASHLCPPPYVSPIFIGKAFLAITDTSLLQGIS